MKKRRAPSPPTVIPIMFLLGCALIGALAWILDRYTSFPGWLALTLAPLTLALLPAEINYSLRRRRICRHIQEDFIVEEVGVQADYSSLLAEIRASTHSPRRAHRARTLQTTGPSTWPTTAPSSH